MKILTIHADYLKFQVREKAIKNAEETDKKEHEIKECLIVFTAVEKKDENDIKEIANKLAEEITLIANQVKTKNIVLYPYAHLSSDLAKPEHAFNVLKEAESLLKKKYRITRAPFGYYKSFELKCKGHPLSELSREIRIEEITTKSEETSFKRTRSQLMGSISQTKLDTSKLKENDHRILGQKLGLFMFNESSPGSTYWLPNGLIIYNELISFWREEHVKAGYQETMTPLVNKKELYEISGHWNYYKEHMFVAPMGEEAYCLKPMNCPNAMLIFKSQTRSYKDLPLRLSDIDRLHRYELSGVLNGLLRVRAFQQDDAHNFVTEDMVDDEFANIFKICEKFYGVFGLEYTFRMGTRPEKALGDEKIWKKAEKMLEAILKKSGKKFTILNYDGAFYGPKVDIIMTDSLGREWQMGTIQLDFNLPEQFGLKYVDREGKEKTPVCIHRVIYGSLERFIGILLEHTQGKLPLWLSPIQVRIINFTDRNKEATEKIIRKIVQEIPSLRIDSDFRQTTVNDKIRDAELQKIPYTITIGDKEEQAQTLAVRERGKKPVFGIKLETFVKELKEKIEKKQ